MRSEGPFGFSELHRSGTELGVYFPSKQGLLLVPPVPCQGHSESQDKPGS
jgi:hypothetical protein